VTIVLTIQASTLSTSVVERAFHLALTQARAVLHHTNDTRMAVTWLPTPFMRQQGSTLHAYHYDTQHSHILTASALHLPNPVFHGKTDTDSHSRSPNTPSPKHMHAMHISKLCRQLCMRLWMASMPKCKTLFLPLFGVCLTFNPMMMIRTRPHRPLRHATCAAHSRGRGRYGGARQVQMGTGNNWVLAGRAFRDRGYRIPLCTDPPHTWCTSTAPPHATVLLAVQPLQGSLQTQDVSPTTL
jgi:hypothetical protein